MHRYIGVGSRFVIMVFGMSGLFFQLHKRTWKLNLASTLAWQRGSGEPRMNAWNADRTHLLQHMGWRAHAWVYVNSTSDRPTSSYFPS